MMIEEEIVTKVLGFLPDGRSEKINLAYADIVVAGGLGIGTAENLERVMVLARTIGGEFGCSRPLVQKGWMEVDRQIGQTGQTIRPKLYLAAGISGAVQHRVGVEGADLIVAINTDGNAPIFDFAHVVPKVYKMRRHSDYSPLKVASGAASIGVSEAFCFRTAPDALTPEPRDSQSLLDNVQSA